MSSLRVIRNTKAVFTKQMLSFFTNMGFYGPAAFFLGLAFLFSILAPGSEEEVVPQFVILFTGISMISVSAGFIAEDRMTMNLRFMSMAGVRPYQYLIASAATLLLIAFAALLVYGLIGRYSGQDFVDFLIIAMLGAVNSILLGTTFGLHKVLSNFAIVIGLLLGIGPNFAEFNETLHNIFFFTYTMQVNLTMRGEAYISDSVPIMLANTAVILIAFIIMNTRVNLDGERKKRLKVA